VLLIGLFTGNDVQLTGREFTPWGVSKPVYAVEDGALVRKNRGDVCADALARSLLFRWLWHDQATAVQLVRLFCNPVELPTGALEATIARLFDEIEALGRAQHVRVLWVLLPTSNELSVYNPDRTRYLNKYPLMKRLLAEGHHEMLDFYPEIVKSKARLEDVFLEDRSHMRPLGHKLLADYLLRYLEAQKLL
jgi:hypothetical protein